jgi:hypothetical protein
MADEAPKVSKPFLVIAGIGVLVIVAFLAMKVLGGGGGGSSATSSSTAGTAAAGAPSASTTTTTAPASPSTPNQSFDVFTTKNPFQPLVTDSASTSFNLPTTDTSIPTSTDVTPPATIPTDQAPSAGTPVSVLEVVDAGGVVSARVQVGSQVYTVHVGDTFATSYRVVSLDPTTGCGQFQFGDTPFELCTGQQTLK